MLTGSCRPWILPYQLTLADAPPQSSLTCLCWGAGVVKLPVILINTGVVYGVYRGKLGPDQTDH